MAGIPFLKRIRVVQCKDKLSRCFRDRFSLRNGSLLETKREILFELQLNGSPLCQYVQKARRNSK
jgi:hypothetical protein